MRELSWRDVFNTGHMNHGSVAGAAVAAFVASYPFFAFNGRVYRTADSAHPVGTVSELITKV